MVINKFFRASLLLLILTIGITYNGYSQDILNSKDLSQLKVSQLTDADISKFKAQLSSSGMSLDQAEKIALQKGMPLAEFNKLKERILTSEKNNSITGKLKSVSDNDKQNNNTDSSNRDKNKNGQQLTLINPLIFGSELYSNVSPSFEPNLKLATPMNYILGPDDEIQVSVFGVQEYTGNLAVSSEGTITIPSVGQIKVAGLTIEHVTQKLKTVMGNLAYPYLKSGEAKLSVTLSKIRSIRVTIIGAKMPGNYTLSSLSTVFNALFLAGGPSTFGSFREIELVRDNKVERKVDLYRLLLKGDQSDNIGLKDNDIIRIPSYKTRVELQGQVKRPGIFEVLPGETFANVLEFASGFTDTAYQASIKVFQLSEKERKIKDILASEYNKYQPQSGDVFNITKILDRFQNRVRINGAVFRPDVYELTEGLSVGELIRRADGLKEDAYIGRGQILRLQTDLFQSILSFDIAKALAGDKEHDLILKREDEVLISTISELQDSLKVTIQGEIRIPGVYNYVKNLTLRDLILQAGGLTDAAFKNIEIARLVKRDSVTTTDNRLSSILNIDVDGDLSVNGSQLLIRPFDVITIRRKAGYVLPESVVITGQVQFPGPYVLSSRGERVSDLVKRAGGFTSDAYLEGAFLRRFVTDSEKEKRRNARRVQQNLTNLDSSNVKLLDNEIGKEFDNIPLSLVEIMKSPGAIEDVILRSSDELVIPKFNSQVKISGSVLFATQVPYEKRNSFKDYLSIAGGAATNANIKNAFVVYPNGKASATKRFLFFKSFPKVLPGSEIIIPRKEDKRRVSTGEIIGISSAIASLAGVVIALFR
jgi:protein involved in polysaccharide export with SLBB domain